MWARKFEKCVRCGTTENKHLAKGFCIQCYTLKTEADHKNHSRNKRGVADEFLTKEKLNELYHELRMSLTDIGILAGCTRVNVHYKLKKFGLGSRSKADARTLALDKGKISTSRIDPDGIESKVVFQKIRFNEDFFKTWSAEMAYVLGLIYTDGNLHFRKDKSGYELGVLSFGQKDKELVVKCLNLMDCDAKIRYKARKVLDNTVSGELYYFSIGNNLLAKDLLELGLIPNKSLSMKFPEIPEDYLRHFVRGIFEGDGSVYLESGRSIRIKLLSGSKQFIEELNQKLIALGFSKRPIYGGTPSTPNAYFIRYNSITEVRKFFSLIYSGVSESNFLSRKKRVFLDFFKLN